MNAFTSELPTMLWWYGVITCIGLIFFPLTSMLFKPLPDSGYAFSKILGIALISYVVWFLSSLHIVPFNLHVILLVVAAGLGANLYIWKKTTYKIRNTKYEILIFEELLFLTGFLFLVFIRGHEPSIHGLEKYMDFGFINTILHTTYFPPQDMWLAPETNPGTYTGGFSINYYYFGHYVTALLTKLSGIGSHITYNLMLATIFGMTLSGMFSIGFNLFRMAYAKSSYIWAGAAGFLSGLIVTIGGNLHTLYLFTSGYENEHPVPFWQIFIPASEYAEGAIRSNYWYPNATRFIPNTIHEFPSYSWVVADLHGHVLDIPFVLLTLATILSLLASGFTGISQTVRNLFAAFLGLMCGIMYMTNAWDGLIYLGTSLLVLTLVSMVQYGKEKSLSPASLLSLDAARTMGILIVSFILFNLPFTLSFVPFVHGIGVVGGYEIADALHILHWFPAQELTTGGTNSDVRLMGPLLLEKGNNLRSPTWMLFVLWGFFALCAYLLMGRMSRTRSIRSHMLWIAPGAPLRSSQVIILSAILLVAAVFTEAFLIPGLPHHIEPGHMNTPLPLILAGLSLLFAIIGALFLLYHYTPRSVHRVFLLTLIVIAGGLILVPEIIYAKDIYPGHYRANTMFKLGYQAFILLSAVAGFSILSIGIHIAALSKKDPRRTFLQGGYLLLLLTTALVLSYSYYAISSYYGAFKSPQQGGRTYETVDGTAWLEAMYPDDYAAIQWFKNQPATENEQQTTVLEAVGDSYTDYGRISVHTGIPTVLGWPVHEWLWRGSYDEPGARVDEVKRIYEGTDKQTVRTMLEQFHITHIIIGKLERDKYPALNEQLLTSLGEKVFESGGTAVYKLN